MNPIHTIMRQPAKFIFSGATQRVLMNLEAQVHNMRCRLERLHRKVSHELDIDLVTGLPNRLGFSHGLEAQCQRVREGHSRGGTLVLVDIDNFDDLLDRHGQYVTSLCLKQVADILIDEFLYYGQPAYVGGGEFGVIVSDRMKLDLVHDAECVRSRLDHIFFEWKDQIVRVKSSVGLHAYSASDRVERLFSFGESDDNELISKNRYYG